MKIITIKQDMDNDSPRGWETFGTLYCWHSRYVLGEGEDEDNQEQFSSLNIWLFDRFSIPGLDNYYTSYGELEVYEGEVDWLYFNQQVDNWAKDHFFWEPIYMYEHSGVTIRTNPFGCRWDSGMVGIIWAVRDNPETTEEEYIAILRSEIAELDQYLRGDVWWFAVYEGDSTERMTELSPGVYLAESYSGDMLDSCGGFYGYDYCLEEAHNVAKSI